MIITRKQKWGGKQIYRHFKRLINNISLGKNWTWLTKENIRRETESLLMAAQNRAISTNHIKARIAKTQENSKCRQCNDREETIHHILSGSNKLAQKEYKARHDRSNVKWRISTSTLLENWKSCGTWKWRLYQLWLVVLVLTKGLLKGHADLEVGGRIDIKIAG